MNEGTLGGKFTTIEGLIKDSIEQLDKICPFFFGDSEDKRRKGKMRECLEKLESFMKGEMMNVTVILDDPTGNSYLQVIFLFPS
jgi:zinc finger protein